MILASQSPRRRALLADAGFTLTVVPADIDEAPRPSETPVELVGRLSAEKAEAVRSSLSGRTHRVSTGVCAMLLRADGSLSAESRFVETTEVTFWDLTESQVAAYVATGEPLDKAGAYGIQGTGRLLVRAIRGDYENVVGLPVSRLVRELGALQGARGDLVADAIRLGGPHA